MCRLQSSLTLTWCSRIPGWSLIWGRVLHYIFVWARNISPDILFHGKELTLSQYNPVCLGAARTVRKVIFPHSHCPSCSCRHTGSHSALCGRTEMPCGDLLWNPEMFNECPFVDYIQGAEPPSFSLEWHQAVLFICVLLPLHPLRDNRT